jgi:hypothetical protein
MFGPRRNIAMAIAFCAGAMFGGACQAAEDPFGGAPPVSAGALQAERAGFTADGLTFGFSATLETLINGQVALTTTLTLLDDGSVAKQTTVDSQLLAGNSGAGGGGPSIDIPVNNAATLAAALSGSGVSANGLSGTGLVIKSNTGVTALLDNVGPNQLQNIVINTANGQNIVQNTALTITLPAASIAGMQAGTIMNAITSGFQFAQLGH